MNNKMAILMLGVACGFAAPAVVSAYTGEELANQAVLPLKEAQAVALQAFPGVITDTELEKEKGGSGLRYSFVISSKGDQHEVGVDAMSGTVLENIPEGANSD